MRTERFADNGSPLGGRAVPRDWADLDARGKRARMMALGWARDWRDAGRLLGLHGAAARRKRAERATATPTRGGAAPWWTRD
jgi:hypothetical protein